jgi:hypothetical protein
MFGRELRREDLDRAVERSQRVLDLVRHPDRHLTDGHEALHPEPFLDAGLELLECLVEREGGLAVSIALGAKTLGEHTRGDTDDIEQNQLPVLCRLEVRPAGPRHRGMWQVQDTGEDGRR